MPTITHELERADSALRCIVDERRNVIAGWRDETLRQLAGTRASVLENKAWAGVAGQGIDHRIRWWLTGFVDPILPNTVTLGLDRCTPRTRELVTSLAQQLEGVGPGSQRPSVERKACLLAMAGGMAEAVFRASVDCPIDRVDSLDDLAHDYRAALDDIVRMSAGLSRTLETFADHETVTPGPGVRIGRLYGDADLLIDRCLVETKATVNPQRNLTNACRQLVAYASMLDSPVEEVALVLPRQRLSTRFDVRRHRPVFDEIRAEIAKAY